MKRKPMDLGVFVFPGGVQYSNRARMVRGDYESIAFIGPSGLVRWDIPREKVDPVIRARVDLDSAETRNKYFRTLGNLRAAQPYNLLYKLYDMMPAALFLEVSGADLPLEEKIDLALDRLVKSGLL